MQNNGRDRGHKPGYGMSVFLLNYGSCFFFLLKQIMVVVSRRNKVKECVYSLIVKPYVQVIIVL